MPVNHANKFLKSIHTGVVSSELFSRASYGSHNSRSWNSQSTRLKEPFSPSCWLVCFGIFWNILEYFGIFWNILEHFGIFWKILNILENFRILWNISVSLRFFRLYSISFHGYLECSCIFWNIKIDHVWSILDIYIPIWTSLSV